MQNTIDKTLKKVYTTDREYGVLKNNKALNTIIHL